MSACVCRFWRHFFGLYVDFKIHICFVHALFETHCFNIFFHLKANNLSNLCSYNTSPPHHYLILKGDPDRKWLWVTDGHENVCVSVCVCLYVCFAPVAPAGVCSWPGGSVTVQIEVTSGLLPRWSSCHRLDTAELSKVGNPGSVAAIFAGLGS